MLARLQALQPPGRGKLLEIADVDGTPVAVTLFISSFQDFPTWLDSVSPSVPATQPRPIVPPPVISAAPRAAEPPRRQEPQRSPGDFTRIFGKLDEFELSSDEVDVPTEIIEAVKPPAPPPPVPIAPPRAASEPEAGANFTAIFGSLSGAAPKGPDLPPAMPATPAPAANHVMPAPAPPVDLRPAAPSPVPQPASEQPGEFTQLFQRLSPTGGGAAGSPFSPPSTPFSPPPSPLAAVPFAVPDVSRPLEPTPRADAPPPPPPGPSLGVPPLAVPALGVPSLGMSSLSAPPPASPPSAQRPQDVPPMPNVVPPPKPIGASMFAGAGPSEFTRILSPITLPSPPAVIQPPAAPPAAGDKGGSKAMLPLIIGLGAVVVLTIAIVVYFVLRK
jgi:hypothetical protein